MATITMSGTWQWDYLLTGGQEAFPTLTQALPFTWNLTEFKAIRLSGYKMEYQTIGGQWQTIFDAVWMYPSAYNLPFEISGDAPVTQEFLNWALQAASLIGEYSAAYDVTFDTRGGVPPQDPLLGVMEITRLPSRVEKEGFFLVGWSYDSMVNIPAQVGDPLTEDVTLYAQWGESGTLTVKSRTGIAEYLSASVDGIQQITGTYDGADRTLTVTTATGRTETLTYKSTPLQGDELLGWSYTLGGDAEVIAGQVTSVGVPQGDLTLYEVYRTDREIDPVIGLQLYRNTAEPERLDKSAFLTQVMALEGALRSDCSLTDPSITIYSKTVPAVNYAALPSFNRFYFINEITSVGRNLWRLDMHVDVLMSWRTQIGGLTAVIERQENVYDTAINDPLIVVSNEVTVTQVRSAYTPFVGAADGAYNVVMVITAPNA